MRCTAYPWHICLFGPQVMKFDPATPLIQPIFFWPISDHINKVPLHCKCLKCRTFQLFISTGQFFFLLRLTRHCWFLFLSFRLLIMCLCKTVSVVMKLLMHSSRKVTHVILISAVSAKRFGRGQNEFYIGK